VTCSSSLTTVTRAITKVII